VVETVVLLGLQKGPDLPPELPALPGLIADYQLGRRTLVGIRPAGLPDAIKAPNTGYEKTETEKRSKLP
jgi:hypothetical protein